MVSPHIDAYRDTYTDTHRHILTRSRNCRLPVPRVFFFWFRGHTCDIFYQIFYANQRAAWSINVPLESLTNVNHSKKWRPLITRLWGENRFLTDAFDRKTWIAKKNQHPAEMRWFKCTFHLDAHLTWTYNVQLKRVYLGAKFTEIFCKEQLQPKLEAIKKAF